MGFEGKHKLEELPLLIIKSMYLALHRIEMYGIEHSVSKQSIKATIKLIRELFEYAPSFTLSRLGEEMLFDKIPLERTYFTDRFVKDFDDFGIHSITFHRKMTDDEFISFLKFLVRTPGKKLERYDIDVYLDELRITSIEVDRVKYVAVTGDVDEQREAEKMLADILSRHPDVIERLLGKAEQSDVIDDDIISQFMSGVSLDTEEYDAVSILNAIVKESGLMNKDDEELSETDKELKRLFEIIQEKLSEERKKEFLDKVEKITDEITTKGDVTSELLEKEFTLTELSWMQSVNELFQQAIQNEWGPQIEYQFRSFLERLFARGEPDKAIAISEQLFDLYDSTGAYWVVDAMKDVIEEAYNTGDDSIFLALLGDMLNKKETSSPDIPHFGIITAALVFFASLLLVARKYSAIYRILLTYDKLVGNDPTISVITDFETFITGLSSPENVQHLLSSIGDGLSSYDLQLQEIVKKMDGEVLTQIIIDELGSRKPSFVATAANILKTHEITAKKYIEKYVNDIERLQRSDSGYMINTEQLRRTMSIFSLAIRLDKEFALPLIIKASSDRDIRVKKHLFFLLMYYPVEQVGDIIEALFLESSTEFQSEVIENIVSKPTPVKDYYLRELFLHFPKLRIKILQSLRSFKNEYVKKFLLDILDQWIIYIDPLPEPAFRKLLKALIRDFDAFSDDHEVRKALKRFRSEWKTEGIVKESFSTFSRRKDEIMEAVDKVLKK